MIKAPISTVSVLAVFFALTASCGSGDDDSPAATGGGAGAHTGGVSGGGSTSTGGSTNTGGSTSTGGSTNTGGSTSTGGTANTVGGADGGDAGAPNINPNACPAEKPAALSACTRRGGQACTYADGGCLCNNQQWECYSSSDCPTSAPANADACTLNGMQCAFGDLACSCSVTNGWTCETPCPTMVPAAAAECTRAANRSCRYDTAGAPVNGPGGMADTTCTCTDGAFNCVSQADCPADVPANASECTSPTLSCAFTGARCTCAADGTWSCTLDCPAATPAEADPCQRPADQSCRYAAGALVTVGGANPIDASCACVDGAFACSTAADCPATAPTNASACTLSGITCPYDDGTSCRCRTSTPEWACTTSSGPGTGGAGGAGGAGGGANGSSGSGGSGGAD
jgi:hypothetical protein